MGKKMTQPNFVYIKLDDMSDLYSTNYMPFAKKFLITQGSRWDHSYVNFPSCAGSRASALTSKAVHNHGQYGDEAPSGGYQVYKSTFQDNDLHRWLHDAGYKTSMIGKITNDTALTDTVPPYYDDWHVLCDPARPFAYTGPTVNDNGVVTKYPDSVYVTQLEADQACAFINSQSASTPFAAFVWTIAPHGSSEGDGTPVPDPRDANLFPTDVMPPRANIGENISDKTQWYQHQEPTPGDPVELQHDWLQRQRTLAGVDRLVKQIVNALDAKGLLANTYIILDSDNGWSEGSHNLEGKIFLWEESVRVPLYIRGPLIIPNTTYHQLVNNLDIPATIADLAGITPPYTLDGVSLKPIFSNPSLAWRSAILIENKQTQGIRTLTDLYMETNTGPYGFEAEYYNLVGDILENNNKIDDPANAPRIAVLASLLATQKTATGAGLWIP